MIFNHWSRMVLFDSNVFSEMETDDTSDGNRLQNYASSRQDSRVENVDSVSSENNLHPNCDNPDSSSTSTSAIPIPHSLSSSQTAVSEGQLTQAGLTEATRRTANPDPNPRLPEVRNIITGEQRRLQAGLLVQEEPVISLQYSSEGTTNSTVRLGFARFENLEAGILERSAENASLQPLVREATPTGSTDFENRNIDKTRQTVNTAEDNEKEKGEPVGFVDSTDSSDIFDSDSFSGESGKEESGEKGESAIDSVETSTLSESHESEKTCETLTESSADTQPSTSSQSGSSSQRAGRREASEAVKEKIRQIGRMRILERLCREGTSGTQQNRHSDDGGTSEDEELPVSRVTSQSDDQSTGSHITTLVNWEG